MSSLAMGWQATADDHRALDAPAVPVEHLPRRGGAGRRGAVRRRRRPDGAAVRGRRPARRGARGGPAHPPPPPPHSTSTPEVDAIRERWPDVRVLAHEREGIENTEPFADGTYAGLDVRALHTPGHTAGMLSFVIDDQVFTGDTLFRGSVGGVRAPGHTTFEDLRSSIMDTLLTLPPETTLRPGHTDPTTVADELENNPFVRVWRGLDAEGDEQCTAMGDPARLVLWGDDYDGGHKAWVRWPDGSDDIVPGSQVQRG